MFTSLRPEVASPSLTASLAVVIPIYNEQANISQVVKEWKDALAQVGADYQLLLINDGSKDNTLDVLKELETKDPQHLVVIDKANSGHGRSCRTGYDAVVASDKVEWVLQIDSDGQCDPVYFAELWSLREKADCIFGKRVQRDDGGARALTSRICKLGATFLGGKDMVDPNVPYRLIRKDVLRGAIERIPASFNIHNVALTYVLKKTEGLRWAYVPIRFRDRQGGSNSINIPDVAHLGIDMLLELRKLK